ncbi:transcriptional regulator [Trinickia terrae]|uniref:Transcriptional regulator n=1 Tax=Trinickia terrae TaxID=2571161 RepID=A0A4U1HX51_9BURK|nr:transcriptional regulator [Trinickia terrae]TKC86295.1 transcriptional regulator [Trinickia terrae]
MTPNRPPAPRPLSEQDIHAYADGLLAPDRALHLRDYLEDRPGEARRVAFYGRLNARIKDVFGQNDEIGGLPAEPSMPRQPRRAALRRKLAGIGDLAAVRMLRAFALALLATSGWIAAIQVSPQALNNAAVMALASTSGTQPSAAPSLFAPPLLAPAGGPSAPDLSAAGLHFAANKLVQLGPFSRAEEFVYINADGKTVVLLTAFAPAARDVPQWIAHRAGPYRLLTWTAHHERHVLAGAAATHGLMRAADVLTAR